MVKKVGELRSKFEDKGCLVVGNGPSLNETPLHAFANVPSIGMNKINMIFDKTDWRPDLIVCLNNLVTKQNRKSFSSSKIPIFLAWKCRWFLGRKRSENVYFLRQRPTLEFSRKAEDWVSGHGGTVTYAALQLAYTLRANPVILVGVDHSFVYAGREQDIVKSSSKDVNHFDPNYFAPGSYWGLPNLELSERAYSLAKHAFETDGRQVLDATVGGQLKIFPKIGIDEAMQRLTGGRKVSDADK